MCYNLCPHCRGNQEVPEENAGFVEAGELPNEEGSQTCPRCAGEGWIRSRFFLEFTFEIPEGSIRYWMPLFVEARDSEEATNRAAALQRAIGENYQNIRRLNVLPETQFYYPYIQEKIRSRQSLKVAKLRVDNWNFLNIEHEPTWDFNEHARYVMENSDLKGGTVAERINSHEFPVRLLRDDPEIRREETVLPASIEELLVVKMVGDL